VGLSIAANFLYVRDLLERVDFAGADTEYVRVEADVVLRYVQPAVDEL
jgi:hypothetical protein